MSDDHWQRELAQVSREQREEELRRLDERWDRLSRGELSPEEDAELRALAETSEEARAAYEAFRPLGPGFHASVVRAVRKQGLPSPAKLLPFRRRSLIGWSAAAAAVAAAASVILLLRPLAPLPGYSLEVTGGVRAWRGEEPTEALALAPGDRFQVIVRPQTAVSDAPRLEALCVLTRSGELRVLEARSEIDPAGGAVKMEGSLDRGVPPGRWTLWAVVGRPGKLPDPAALLSLTPGARERDWVAAGAEVLVRPRAPDASGQSPAERP